MEEAGCLCEMDDDCKPLQNADLCDGTLHCGESKTEGPAKVCQVHPDSILGQCDDEIDCTHDLCNPATGCLHIPLNPKCDDGNQCTDDACHPVDGCTHMPQLIACDDESLCTNDDKCLGAFCVGTKVSCDDGSECTKDSCEPTLGCFNQPLNDGTPCQGGAPNKCMSGECVCIPDCLYKHCGPDGCGATCGQCSDKHTCVSDLCVKDCGNGVCGEDESQCMCPADCGVCPGCCKAGQCHPGDDDVGCGSNGGSCTACYGAKSCIKGKCADFCGNDLCGEKESCYSCPEDCNCCGDVACEAWAFEDCVSCPQDCGLCCGNDACQPEVGEDCASCPADCGSCCGNGECGEINNAETCSTCAPDCGPCPAECGNGVVEGGEPCDDGNFEDGDGCSADCFLEFAETPAPSTVIVTELMRNPKGLADDNAEWVELTNVGSGTVDIGGWSVSDAGTDQHKIALNSLPIQAGGIVVLGASGNPVLNGGVSVDYVYSDFSLSDANDQVILKTAEGEVIDAVQYTIAFYTPPGLALALEPTSYDCLANDLSANWCAAASPLGKGNYGTPGKINIGCQWSPECGNGLIEAGEECDDGNLTEGDGCTGLCEKKIICGDKLIEQGEECDDGNTADGDGCSDQCMLESVCGNLIIEPPMEECEPPNVAFCGPTCKFGNGDPTCGDGIKEGSEACDDGCMKGIPYVCEHEIDDKDDCDWMCQTGYGSHCGDKLVELDEECDPPGDPNWDGVFCSVECTVYTPPPCLWKICCPSPCCGDGMTDKNLGEDCDDGNLNNDDGCSVQCKYELPMEKQGISGTIYFEGGSALPEDKLYVMLFEQEPAAWDEAGAPLSGIPLDEVSYPQPYSLGVNAPGEYWVVAVLDIGGDDGTLGDTGVVLADPVEVVAEQFTQGVDLFLPQPINYAMVSGTVSFSYQLGANDSVEVSLSDTLPPEADFSGQAEVTGTDSPAHYEITQVKPGTYYVTGMIDKGGDAKDEPGPEDLVGAYPTMKAPESILVGAGDSITDIDFSIDQPLP